MKPQTESAPDHRSKLAARILDLSFEIDRHRARGDREAADNTAETLRRLIKEYLKRRGLIL